MKNLKKIFPFVNLDTKTSPTNFLLKKNNSDNIYIFNLIEYFMIKIYSKLSISSVNYLMDRK